MSSGRQAAPCLDASTQPGDSPGLFTGVSAFAFQGTNAHVLLHTLPTEQQADSPAISSPIWTRTRYWLAPQPHALLLSARWQPQQRSAVLHCALDHAAAAVLWQHQVRQPGSLLSLSRGHSAWSWTGTLFVQPPLRVSLEQHLPPVSLLAAVQLLQWAVGSPRAGR